MSNIWRFNLSWGKITSFLELSLLKVYPGKLSAAGGNKNSNWDLGIGEGLKPAADGYSRRCTHCCSLRFRGEAAREP